MHLLKSPSPKLHANQNLSNIDMLKDNMNRMYEKHYWCKPNWCYLTTNRGQIMAKLVQLD